ncbi:unnamed protein product [Lactuca virosa]|uniref:Uncharacterized protein n=1 Tax=Lactuca virosa TaxID=75947 RepID=A0AAU9NAI7_9ASTR|nr:unnamed protein product [Lactuca virosa]
MLPAEDTRGEGGTGEATGGGCEVGGGGDVADRMDADRIRGRGERGGREPASMREPKGFVVGDDVEDGIDVGGGVVDRRRWTIIGDRWSFKSDSVNAKIQIQIKT